MSDNKRSRGFGGKGYYIALVLCAAAIGITSYVYSQGREEPALQTANTPAVITGTVTLPTDAPTAPATDAPEPTAGMLATCAPVDGEVLSGYAMEVRSYNETPRDWRVHNGSDIAAEEGTPVFAAADGEVVSVYEDDVLGYTVVIRHTGGYTSCYCSLGSEISVIPGQQVHMGQAIGVVGQTALVESAMGPHLHFSVTWQDEAMDPREFLAMGQ